MNELVSVIVPVYNVEHYLDRCVETLVNQTYRNLEIILVDDGSPDRSPEICDQWAQKDSRIRVVHKPNGGVSSARNAGMEIAAGAWYFFMDSDDFLPENALEGLVERQQQYGADLVCGSFHIMKKKKQERRYDLSGSGAPATEFRKPAALPDDENASVCLRKIV